MVGVGIPTEVGVVGITLASGSVTHVTSSMFAASTNAMIILLDFMVV
tara:strand:- start:235 stop:375 length:141 start_codon:yes stop_codon:yes gene_type:complete